MSEVTDVLMQTHPKVKMIITRYRYATRFGEISLTPKCDAFWLELWQLPEIQVTQKSFEKWFRIFFPEGIIDLDKGIMDTGIPKPLTYTTTYGESDRVKERFLDERYSTD